MKISPEILNELKAVSPLLAGMEKVNVFQVPEDYFGELSQRIASYTILNNISAVDNIAKINLQEIPVGYFNTLSNSIMAKVKATYLETAEEELQGISSMLFSLKDANVFSVPENYFNSISDSIIAKVKTNNTETIGEELRSISSTLYSLKDVNVFSVPENYLDSVSDSIFAKLKTSITETAGEELRSISPTLFSLKNVNVFLVPENYFISVSDSIIAKVKANNAETAEEELRSISHTLFSLKSANVFTVPENYFESFSDNVNEKVKPQPAKIISMNSRKSWWKYAAAAVVTGVIAFGSLQIFNNVLTNHYVVASNLPGYIKASFQYKNEDDLNAGIAKLSDADIIKYLEKSGNIMDNELLTNNTDVSEMPDQTEYLNDENTLNKYLDKIDAETDNKSTP